MAPAAGTVLRVLYTFVAEEASELAVREGELVAVLDSGAGAADGWILVARLASPAERGFVPMGACRRSECGAARRVILSVVYHVVLPLSYARRRLFPLQTTSCRRWTRR